MSAYQATTIRRKPETWNRAHTSQEHFYSSPPRPWDPQRETVRGEDTLREPEAGKAEETVTAASGAVDLTQDPTAEVPSLTLAAVPRCRHDFPWPCGMSPQRPEGAGWAHLFHVKNERSGWDEYVYGSSQSWWWDVCYGKDTFPDKKGFLEEVPFLSWTLKDE